ELEARVSQRTAQLSAVNRELESFSYSVSHDLRAPLRVINGFSQALAEDYADGIDESARHYLDRIRHGCKHMGELIDDLLQLSRLSRAEMHVKDVDLSSLVRQIETTLREQFPHQPVEVEIADGLVARGDEGLLRVAFTNLLNNAWKFSSKCAQPRVQFGITSDNGQSAYFIRDNGVGFDMAFADKLFGAFQRLHRTDEFEGTGIGLATVERIFHRHGGRIWVNAAVNQGATFYFTLQDKGTG